MACHESNVDFDVKKCERDNVKGLLRQLIDILKSAEEYEDKKKEVYC